MTFQVRDTIRASLLALLMSFSIGAAQAAETAAPQRGFLVFSSGGVSNYVQEEKGALRLQGKLSAGSIDEFMAAGGRLYQMNMLLRKVYELGSDLKPLREGLFKSKTPQWLGQWDGGLLVLSDNAVVYLDASLQEAARLPLEPRRYDQITPALSPQDFDAWEHRGYLLANTGELYVIPLAKPQSSEPLSAALRMDEGASAEGQWINPADRTLNLLVKTEKEERDAKLKPSEWRVIKQQVVLTYNLRDLSVSPARTVVHEKREIHESENRNFSDKEGMADLSRRPPYRSEGRAKGTHIGIISRTTPAYAEAFEEKQSMPRREIVRLMSRGRYQVQALMQEAEGTPLWFQGKEGRYYIESDMEERVLRLQPELYRDLKALPELRGVYFKALAY